jgi:hypothetical protein
MAKGNRFDEFSKLLSKLEGLSIRILGFLLLLITLLKIFWSELRSF